MKDVNSNNRSLGKSLAGIAATTGLILLIPFMAMKFNWQVYDPGNPVPETVNWTLLDFVVMGILLFSAGTIFELISRKVGNRLVVGFFVAVVFFLIWAELAVGIFGTPFAGS